MSAQNRAAVAAARKVASKLDALGMYFEANQVRTLCRSNEAQHTMMGQLLADNIALRARLAGAAA